MPASANAFVEVPPKRRMVLWNMDRSSAELSAVRGHAAVLRRAGYWRLKDGSACARQLHALYRALVFATTCFYLLQECIYAYKEKSDMAKLSRVMFLLLCHVTSLAKQLVFLTDADRIERMVAGLDEAARRARSDAARRLLGRAATHAARLQRGYAGCAAFTCLLWAVFAAQAHARSQPFDFPLWIGVDTTDTNGFVVALLYTYYVTTLVGVANTTMDAFIATVIYQCKTQLSILRMNLERLPQNASALSSASGRRRDDVFVALFVDCWLQYMRICETAGLVQDIFGGAILVQFGIGGWILCMAAYKIISLDFMSIEFASMILFILCILTELFLYCYYGTELTEESALLVDAAYGMQWAGEGRVARRLLLLLLIRARRPLRLAAGRVVPLSLDTFVKLTVIMYVHVTKFWQIMKSSYTFYAVLRQTK